MLLTAVVALNPVGLEFFRSAFFAGEQLARNIAQPIVLTAMAILALIVALEWLVRVFIIKRRARGATTA
jgi:flagellar biogenesis protein FliO